MKILDVAYLISLEQHHVVLAEHRQENDRSNVFETMNPLSSLGSLTAHVDHSVKSSFDLDFVVEFRNYFYRKIIESKSNGYSMIPVVGWRARRMSCSVGR